MVKLPAFTNMNEPITPDQEIVLISRLTNKLNQLLTQLANNELFPQVDATARSILQDRLKETYTLSDRILSQLKKFRDEAPEFKLNLHESALCKVVDRTKDLLGTLADYQNELTYRFNQDIHNRSWAVDVAEWFCREIHERFHVHVNPVDRNAVYNAKSPSVIIDLSGQSIPCIKHFALYMDPEKQKVRLEAHTDLDYTDENVKKMLNSNSKVLQATKNENGRLVLYTSYTPHPAQNIVERFQRLTARLALIQALIRAFLLKEIA